MGAIRGQRGLSGSGGSQGSRVTTRRSLSRGTTRITETVWGARGVPAKIPRTLLARDDPKARQSSRGQTARVRLGPSPPLLLPIYFLEEESCTVDAYVCQDCAAKVWDTVCCGCPEFKNEQTARRAGRT